MRIVRRVVWVLWVVAALAASSRAARAQVRGFDGERLAPAAGAAGGVFVERPIVPFHLGYGLGLFGKLDPTSASILGVGLYIVQLSFSVWWLNRYRFGPFEWLWRSMTYGRRQPMRQFTAPN